MRPLLFLLALPLFAAVDPVWEAIRKGDRPSVERLIAAAPGVSKPDGTTPLMMAVLTADSAMVRLLLDRGAAPDTANRDGFTALHFAGADDEKALLLLAKGANSNAVASNGVTPLLVAAGRYGSAKTVAALLRAGADASATAKSGLSPLDRAAQAGDEAVLRLLFAAGAKLPPRSAAVYLSAKVSCLPCARLLLEKGADVNQIGARGETALHNAAIRANAPFTRLLLQHKAVVHVQDSRGYTALMRAAISFNRDPETLNLLLQAGAKPNVTDEDGNTALTLALRFGESAITERLAAAGATGRREDLPSPSTQPAKDPRQAVTRAIPLLQRTGPPVWKTRGCTSCHSNSQPAAALATARRAGVPFDEAAADRELRVQVAMETRTIPNLRTGFTVPEITSYVLDSMAARDYQPNALTDAEVHHYAFHQRPDGEVPAREYRVPQQYTSITLTAYAVRAFRTYAIPGRAAEFAERVRRSTEWLAARKPVGVEEQALRLLGLRWGQAAPKVTAEAAAELEKAQREDGGWAQMPYLASDPYATALALHALGKTNPRATQYLLRTQYPDGSWFVQTRAHPLQPKMDSGFPFGYNQWISAAATSLSLEALLHALPAE